MEQDSMSKDKKIENDNLGNPKLGKKARNHERDMKRLETKAKRDEHLKKEKNTNRLIFFVTISIVIVLISVTAGIKYEATTLSSVKSYTKLGRKHVPGTVKYAQTPPVGGNHAQEWLNCGIYTQPVPNENAVHSMEHSAVWVTYDPKIITGTKLVTLQKEMLIRYGVLSPYPGISTPIVATAWGKQIALTKVDDPKLIEFIQLYAGSLKAPEPRGECSGGLNAPGRIA